MIVFQIQGFYDCSAGFESDVVRLAILVYDMTISVMERKYFNGD
jgi:hypothetical protein